MMLQISLCQGFHGGSRLRLFALHCRLHHLGVGIGLPHEKEITGVGHTMLLTSDYSYDPCTHVLAAWLQGPDEE